MAPIREPNEVSRCVVVVTDPSFSGKVSAEAIAFTPEPEVSFAWSAGGPVAGGATERLSTTEVFSVSQPWCVTLIATSPTSQIEKAFLYPSGGGPYLTELSRGAECFAEAGDFYVTILGTDWVVDVFEVFPSEE
jgi:hypothetical protein